MKQNTYTEADSRWYRVANTPNCKKVPNIFMQIMYDYFDIIPSIGSITEIIEAGTFEGDSAEIFAEHFDKVHTVEQYVTNNSYTGINLVEKYQKIRLTHPNIDFYQGESAEFLAKILKDNPLTQYVILLDAHTPDYSPIVAELQAIIQHSKRNDHVIIVDDCIDLDGPGWPTTHEFELLIKQINPNYCIDYTTRGRKIVIIYDTTRTC